MGIESLVHIKVNRLLRDGEKTLTLPEVLALRELAVLAGQNLATVPVPLVGDIEATYGGAGLFQLVGLAMAHDEAEFRHFFEVTSGWLTMRSVLGSRKTAPLRLDNASLPQSPAGSRLSLNFVQPSLSRKLYRAGRHHGSLVYGLGGPRILVSHPFRGRVEDIYDVYGNSVDVVTSLQMRGFDGVFHFLDYLPGLDQEVNGIPGWLAWFAIIAAHSDLVLYVRDPARGFRPTQQRESEFTPDRVQKAIVDIPRDELRWARKAEATGAPRMYISNGTMMTEAEWLAMEAAHAMPFIESYTDGSLPTDRLIRVDESGDFTEYPLDYPLYGRP